LREPQKTRENEPTHDDVGLVVGGGGGGGGGDDDDDDGKFPNSVG
jgi:hypothetical protein